MAETTLIEWTDHTFAPWFGCTEVDRECDNCYAEYWTVARFHKAGWGPHAERERSAASTWKQPLAYQRKAAKDGVRRRIFCSELSDVFDNHAPTEWRADLWDLIRSCPDLDWLLLTKRPQNIRKMLPVDWRSGWPNVWLGTTAGHQKAWDRVDALRTIPATVRLVSVEPMLEPVQVNLDGIGWVICGETVKSGQKNDDGMPCHSAVHGSRLGARFTLSVQRRRCPVLHEADDQQGVDPRRSGYPRISGVGAPG